MTFDHDGVAFEFEGAGEGDHLVRIMARNRRFYEADLLDYMRGLRIELPAHHRSVALDVGANIGNHSVYLRRFVADHVLSFEPNPHVLPALRRNLERNLPEGGFTVIERALGKGAGHGAMRLDEASVRAGNSGMAQVVLDGDAPAEGVLAGADDILVTPLDDALEAWLEDHSDMHPTLIKIDVEGMEPDVLEGAARTLDRWHPDLFLEAGTPAASRSLDALLGERGYTSLCTWGHTSVHHFRHAARLSDRLRAQRAKVRARLRRLARRIGARAA